MQCKGSYRTGAWGLRSCHLPPGSSNHEESPGQGLPLLWLQIPSMSILSFPKSNKGGGAAISASDSSATPVHPAIALPRYVMDEEIERCFGCAVAFDFVHRRHHCRRCRNIFCAACTSRERPVLLYMLTDPVRVCLRCGSEVLKENDFIDVHLHALLKGLEVTMPRGVLGKRHPVTLLLSPDLDTLQVVDLPPLPPSLPPSQPRKIIKSLPLLDIGGVSEEASLSFILLTTAGSRFKFETSGPGQRQAWVCAIREAAKHLPQMKGLKKRVEEERRQREMQERMMLVERQEKEALLAKKREKAAMRNAIADKYGLARR
ncbi:hypothetical protein VYU27_005200 [Nannochloropsis oceanica]